MSKQYGLILPNKNKSQLKPENVLKRPSVFDEDSDSDTQASKKPTGFKKALKRQDRAAQDRALEEDPTVFQYDEIYDEMDKKRKDNQSAKKAVDKKPKYINMLLAAADRRKKENEQRIEREVQKEREAEGEMYKDKEAFVTSAYKKKLEERKLLEEQEKREAYLEAIGNVENQGNLDGFYRHLYEQKVKCEDEGADKVTVKEEVDGQTSGKSEGEENESECKRSPKRTSKLVPNCGRKGSSSSQSDSDETRGLDKSELKQAKKLPVKNRKYRKHASSESDSSVEGEKLSEPKKEHLPSNLDADSDFSIDSSDSEDDDCGKNVPKKDDENGVSEVQKDCKNTEGTTDAEEKQDKANFDTSEVKPESEELPPKKPKIDIWKKRTIGEVYEAALQRYFMRKSIQEGQQL